ncbi:hypothetical protein U1737_13540 [Sphingomonas sp. LB3N6]|uniref:hypothetical protein n=1 Tax=Sphingomonas fucosidasi TaxID=3096164 RepID=UPI002FC781EE
MNTRGSRNITGFVCSRKMAGRTIDHESRNELAFIKRAEIDPRVTSILAQPMLARYRDAAGVVRDSFPDFAIHVDGRLEIHEVKPDAQYARPEVRDRLKRIADAAERQGIAYGVVLASDLHRSKDAPAIEDAWRRLKTEVAPDVQVAVDDCLANGPLPLGEVVMATARHRTSVVTMHALLAQGRIRADMTKAADLSMLLHSRHGEVWFERLISFRDPRENRR